MKLLASAQRYITLDGCSGTSHSLGMPRSLCLHFKFFILYKIICCFPTVILLNVDSLFDSSWLQWRSYCIILYCTGLTAVKKTAICWKTHPKTVQRWMAALFVLLRPLKDHYTTQYLTICLVSNSVFYTLDMHQTSLETIFRKSQRKLLSLMTEDYLQ